MRRPNLLVAAGAVIGAAAAFGLGAILTTADSVLPWSYIGGGGGASSGSYAASVSYGQTASGTATSTGFAARLGFWAGTGSGAPADADSDGVPDVSDNCPEDFNPGQQNVVHPGTSAGDHCEDPEPDGVVDASDNCPDTANPGQENTDGDPYGDVCETAACVTVPNYWSTPADDPDCDGFPSTANTGPPLNRGNEAFIGTMADVQCAANSGANNEPLPDAWPMDFNDDQRANTLDVTGNYIGNLNKPLGDPAYAARRDLNSNNAVNTLDVLLFVPFLNKVCTP